MSVPALRWCRTVVPGVVMFVDGSLFRHSLATCYENTIYTHVYTSISTTHATMGL